MDQTPRKFLQVGTATFAVQFGFILDIILDFILELNFGIDFLLYFGSHFRSILTPKPHKMKVPQEIRRRLIFGGLECAIWNICWKPFWIHFGSCLGRLDIVKTCILKQKAYGSCFLFEYSSHFGVGHILEQV